MPRPMRRTAITVRISAWDYRFAPVPASYEPVTFAESCMPVSKKHLRCSEVVEAMFHG